MTDHQEDFIDLQASILRIDEPVDSDQWRAVGENGVSMRVREGAIELRGPWTGVMGRPLPAWLAEVVEPLLRDFQLPTPIDVVVGYGKDHRGHNVLWVQEPTDGGPVGFEITDDVRRGDLIVTLGDVLQEQFFLETAQSWGQPRPPCPIQGHGHPLYASRHEGRACWLCPATNSPVAAIGRLDQRLR